MTSTDAENPLAYLDYSQLQNLIEANWALFEPALIRQPSWAARQEELARIRHRIGHMRRPHEDDLNRIEQMLRDLNRGAFVACASYNQRITLSADKHNDAVTTGWLRKHHPTAKLLDHADSQYGTHLGLTVSRRPWAQWPDSLTNAAGILWHAGFCMRSRSIDVSDFWHASGFAIARSLVVHLVADDSSHISLTFAAADDDQAISDAIGDVLETCLSVSRHGLLDENDEKRWSRRALETDYRVIHATGWNIIDETTIPISPFGAGSGLTAPVRW